MAPTNCENPNTMTLSEMCRKPSFDGECSRVALVRGSAFVRNSVFDIFYFVAAVGTLQRTDFGRPQAGIRFSIATPITAFVC